MKIGQMQMSLQMMILTGNYETSYFNVLSSLWLKAHLKCRMQMPVVHYFFFIQITIVILFLQSGAVYM